MHDVIIVGVPLLAILAGVLFNRNDTKDMRLEMRAELKDIRAESKDLRAEMNARFNKLDDHLGRIDADLRQFYHLTGKLEASMDAIEKRD